MEQEINVSFGMIIFLLVVLTIHLLLFFLFIKHNKMAQQTAVEWFYKNLIVYMNGDGDFESAQQIYEQAKAMEKQQIIDADLNATIRTAKGANSDVSVRRVKELAEEYYNKTYNK